MIAKSTPKYRWVCLLLELSDHSHESRSPDQKHSSDQVQHNIKNTLSQYLISQFQKYSSHTSNTKNTLLIRFNTLLIRFNTTSDHVWLKTPRVHLWSDSSWLQSIQYNIRPKTLFWSGSKQHLIRKISCVTHTMSDQIEVGHNQFNMISDQKHSSDQIQHKIWSCVIKNPHSQSLIRL